MPISLEEVRHVARLARLELEEAELVQFQAELDALIGHFADLEGIDTEGLAPKPHAVQLTNVFDDDVPTAPLSREQALRNAPVSRAGLFIVPTIIEE